VGSTLVARVIYQSEKRKKKKKKKKDAEGFVVRDFS